MWRQALAPHLLSQWFLDLFLSFWTAECERKLLGSSHREAVLFIPWQDFVGLRHVLFAAAPPTRVLAVYTRLSVCSTKPRLSHSALKSIFSLRLWRKFIFACPADSSCQGLPMEMDGPHFTNYPKSTFCLFSALVVMKVTHFNWKQKSGKFSAGVLKTCYGSCEDISDSSRASAALLRDYNESVNHIENQCIQWKR